VKNLPYKYYPENMSNSYTFPFSWHDIDWRKTRSKVSYYQNQLSVAELKGNSGLVTTLQQNLVKSFAGRALAVRSIASNKGKNTPGIDGVIWDTSDKKMDAIYRLGEVSNYRCSPVRRVYIPKPGGKLRPLGIPNMYDRGLQYLWKLALDPIAECRADRHSYGFRKGRSTQDVQTIMHLLLSPSSRCDWVLEADIKGFFDSINHAWIMQNIPMDKDILLEWLKAGALEIPSQEFHKGVAGVPQGGPISPLIANMTLDGLQGWVISSVKHLHKKSKVTSWSPKVNVIRYADDFVVTASTKRILDKIVKPAVQDFLSIRGLELNHEKSCITSVKKGFDFVGFHFRVYSDKSGPKDAKSIVKPTIEGKKRLRSKIKDVVKLNRSSGEIIKDLNPILRGWANYYKATSAKTTFTSIGKYLWDRTWTWAKRKHRTLNFRDLAERFYTRRGKRKWIFKGELMGKELTIFLIDRVAIKRHSLARDYNPYLLDNEDYFQKRNKRLTSSYPWNDKKRKLLKRDKYKCRICNEFICGDDIVEIHHIKPRRLGGNDSISNSVVLHAECHKQLTHTKSRNLLAQFRREQILDD